MYKQQLIFQKLSSFHLKIIAMITMLLDHIGAYLISPTNVCYLPLRIIGRIAMPLYAFFIVEGMRYTTNQIRYLLQLLGMGIIINLGELIFLHTYSGSIFDTFFIAGLTIYFLMKKEYYYKILAVFPFVIGILSGFSFFPIKLEYGPYGVITVLIFYLSYITIKTYGKYTCIQYDLNFEEYQKSGSFTFYYASLSAILLTTFNLLCLLFQTTLYLYFTDMSVDYTIQSYTIFSCILLLFYNGKRGFNHPAFKYGCYAFYPLHLIILYLIKIIFKL